MSHFIIRILALPATLVVLQLYASCYGIGQPQNIYVHQGICDASGVVDLDQGRFAVADDELNMLLVYEAHGTGKPIYKTEISNFLDVVKPLKQPKQANTSKKVKPRNYSLNRENRVQVKEVDIEGATRVGDTVYWIASHGRKKPGKEPTERMRFFATDIVGKANHVKLIPKGNPYDSLIVDLLDDPRYAELGLEAATNKAPHEVGRLNIEALTDRSDGALLIGFRSPLIEGKSLVVPLLNAEGILHGELAQFGDPILLDLGGIGIRGMASHDGTFLIVANDPEGDDHRPKMFRWDGITTRVIPIHSLAFGDFNPEAVAILSDFQGGQVLMLSDDGMRPIGVDGCPCKKLKDHNLRRFRSATFSYSDFDVLSQN